MHAHATQAQLRRLRQAGREVRSHRGTFGVPRGTKDLDLIVASDKAVKKYVERFEKQGWKLEDRPRVKLVPTIEEEEYHPIPAEDSMVVMWVPKRQPGMRSDHPWYVPDQDQYQVNAWFSRKPVTYQIQMSDDKYRRMLAQGSLPGLKVVE